MTNTQTIILKFKFKSLAGWSVGGNFGGLSGLLEVQVWIEVLLKEQQFKNKVLNTRQRILWYIFAGSKNY